MDENVVNALVKEIQLINEKLSTLMQKRMGKNDIIPGTISQGHMANQGVIIFDIAANRPTVGTNSCIAFFSTDTHICSIWDGKKWRTSTFT